MLRQRLRLPDIRARVPQITLDALTGFENHQGATVIGPAARPLARVLRGIGNRVGDGGEGVVQGRMIGTYLHAPVLARNPDLADLPLGWTVGAPPAPLDMPSVVRRRATRLGTHQLDAAGRRQVAYVLTDSPPACRGRPGGRATGGGTALSTGPFTPRY